jgi:hypothetical protein
VREDDDMMPAWDNKRELYSVWKRGVGAKPEHETMGRRREQDEKSLRGRRMSAGAEQLLPLSAAM